MMAKLSRFGMAVLAFALAAGLTLFLTGNLRIGRDGASSERKHDHDACGDSEAEGEHDDCAAGGKPAQCADDACGSDCDEVDFAALSKMNCEHAIAAVECDHCRFEVGVVKVQPSVAKALLGTEKAEMAALGGVLKLTGRVEFDGTRLVDVPPPLPGRVVAVRALLGDRVERGQVLAVIHSSEFGEAKAAYLQAYRRCEVARKEQERQAAVAGALGKFVDYLLKQDSAGTQTKAPGEPLGEWRSKLVGAAARLQLARAALEREKGLWEKQVSSRAEYEQARQELDAAEADYAGLVEEVHLGLGIEKLKAENAVKEAEAERLAAEQRLHIAGLDDAAVAALPAQKDNGEFAWLALKAPRAGSVVRQSITEGKVVETSESIFTIADSSNLWIWCDLYERNLAALHGMEKAVHADVRVPAFAGAVFPGTLDLIGSVVDAQTQTVKARVQVANADGRLKPGMFASVEVRFASDKQAVTVPANAVLSDENKSFVFQHWQDDLWVRRNVVTGRKQGDRMEIVSGLKAGATVVVSGGFMLKSDILREKMGAGCAD